MKINNRLNSELDSGEHFSCKYCLESDNINNLISPCKCKGSSKYVHKECLLKWFDKKNNQVVIPAYFNQYNVYNCEICKYKYNIEYVNKSQSNLCFNILLYIFYITVFLFFSYLCTGLLMQLNPRSATLFSYMSENGKLANIFWNGFCMTHLILGIFYICVFVYFASRDSHCTFIYCGNCCDSNSQSCDGIIIIIIIIICILGTVILIYYDILSRVKQRYENNGKMILDIKSYDVSEV